MKRFFKAFILTLTIGAAMAVPAMPVMQDEIKMQIVEAAAKYKDGNLSGAISQLEAALEKAPDNPEVLSWLGFFYIKNNQSDLAVKVLEKAQKAKPDDLEVINNLGNAYLATKRDDMALAQYKKIVEKSPNMYEPWYNIGGICLRKQDFTGAVGAYEKALSLRKDAPDGYSLNNLGIAYEGAGQLAKATEYYQKAVTARPDEKLFSRNAGFGLFRLGKSEEALPYLETAAQGEVDVDAASALAQIYIKQGKTDMALSQYTALESSRGDKSDYWYNLGVLRSAAKDSKGAEAAYRKSISMNQKDKDAINNLGLLLFSGGRYEDALPFFERLYKMNPTSATQLNYASCLSQVGDLKKSVSLWNSYLSQNPKRTDVRVEMANAQWQMGDKESARSNYAAILAVDPKNVQAMNGMGLYYYAADRLKDAEAAFRKSISVKAAYLPPYNNLAVTLERMNRKKEAMTFLEKALSMNPNYVEAKRNLERMRASG